MKPPEPPAHPAEGPESTTPTRNTDEGARTVQDTNDSPEDRRDPHQDDRLMTPGEVAAYFKIDPKTVSRHVTAGRLTVARRTPGGHARFWESDVIAAGQRQSGGTR